MCKITPPRYVVELTSGAIEFDNYVIFVKDPFIIRDNTVEEGKDGQYYDIDGIYQTFESEEDAQRYADMLNRAEQENAEGERVQERLFSASMEEYSSQIAQKRALKESEQEEQANVQQNTIRNR